MDADGINFMKALIQLKYGGQTLTVRRPETLFFQIVANTAVASASIKAFLLMEAGVKTYDPALAIYGKIKPTAVICQSLVTGLAFRGQRFFGFYSKHDLFLLKRFKCFFTYMLYDMSKNGIVILFWIATPNLSPFYLSGRKDFKKLPRF